MPLNNCDLTKTDHWNIQMNHLSRLKQIRGCLLLLIFALSALSSCKDEVELFKIIRVPAFTFSFDNLNKQSATQVNFYQGKKALHSYPTGVSELYTRYLMQVAGTNTAGKKYTISIELDLLKQDSYVGIYKPTYVIGVGGIYSFNYLEEVSPGSYKSYNVDPLSPDQPYFRIQKQNMEEKLILGDFLAKLQNDQNPSEKITFYQGTFNDIFYGAQ